MRFNEIINSIVADYVNAWNRKDVKKIMGIFSENAELESPLFAGLPHGLQQSKLVGKETLETSYRRLFDSPSYFKMDPTKIESHDKVVTTYMHTANNHTVVKSIFTLNEYGKLQYLRITKED